MERGEKSERGSSTSVRVDFPFAPIPLDFLNIRGRKLDRSRVFSRRENVSCLRSSAGLGQLTGPPRVHRVAPRPSLYIGVCISTCTHAYLRMCV